MTSVYGGHWQGVAAEAARRRAYEDRSATATLADHLERAATIAEEGYLAINAPLQRTDEKIRALDSRTEFTVMDDLSVHVWGPSTATQLDDAEAARLEQLKVEAAVHQRDIRAGARAIVQADGHVRDALHKARTALLDALVASGALGWRQAETDAERLMTAPWSLSPEQLWRLSEAVEFTPGQQADLRSGKDIILTSSQFEYMFTIARSFDGKSPLEIEAMLNRSGSRTEVANVLQLLSNPRVTTSVRGDEVYIGGQFHRVPSRGGADLLPVGMYESLTRDDLVNNERAFVATELRGVAENQAIAGIAEQSAEAVRPGSGLDAKLFDAASTYRQAHEQAVADDTRLIVDGKEFDGGAVWPHAAGGGAARA